MPSNFAPRSNHTEQVTHIFCDEKTAVWVDMNPCIIHIGEGNESNRYEYTLKVTYVGLSAQGAPSYLHSPTHRRSHTTTTINLSSNSPVNRPDNDQQPNSDSSSTVLQENGPDADSPMSPVYEPSTPPRTRPSTPHPSVDHRSNSTPPILALITTQPPPPLPLFL